MKESDVDIWCLQGAYFVDIQRQLYGGLKETYPYIHSVVDFSSDFDTRTPACNLSEVNNFFSCVRTLCPTDVFSLDSAVCIASK